MTATPSPVLFPNPAVPAAGFAIAGYDSDSTLALRETLQANHNDTHGYFNRQLKFQNHIPHHLLAIWSFGANREALEATYKHELKEQTLIFDSPSNISAENYHEHLGDDNYYKAYLAFFRDEVQVKGTRAVLHEYVFSPKANTPNASPSKAISRFLDNLIHPMIHIGYGLEYSLPGLVVEGLTLAATLDGKRVDALYPSSLFSDEAAVGPGEHAFDILQHIIDDPSYDNTNKDFNPESFLEDTINSHGDALGKLAAEWLGASPNIDAKIEEVLWACSLLYAVNGTSKASPDAAIYADFFLMHLVTSSLFIPSFIPHLSIEAQRVLLQSYFTTVLVVWVSRGRRALDIVAFYSKTTVNPKQPCLTATRPKWALSSSTNPWFGIMQNSIYHPDDHLCKIQRAFAYNAHRFGATPEGIFKSKLREVEKLDGTIFIRAAGLTATRTSQLSDAGSKFVWDFAWVA
ncbi:hypothetical protein CYLTODRAFT_179273 [Cylindrobasidium torrendii FP15055 ss-10]|uniref:Uncharacterized protein n=1 Tax=Cylindrobasidium torrendii FP15055 ss-10 TaxID=1314674 RepID=A0A0D7BJA7_9AGAR|nr:hypothetical protein CYLTODRAFT_179273 [Cylindrobasidium torrendii FP15055 ss-10]